MRYLKRKLRRSVAGRATEAFLTVIPAGSRPASRGASAPGYVRLVVGDGRQGVFQAAYRLRDSDRLTPTHATDLRGLLRRFETRLKPHAPAEERAVFWFKADAGDHVRRLWAFVCLLQLDGHDVRMWTTRRPGRIVFEDSFQVAAVPFRRPATVEKHLPEPW